MAKILTASVSQSFTAIIDINKQSVPGEHVLTNSFDVELMPGNSSRKIIVAEGAAHLSRMIVLGGVDMVVPCLSHLTRVMRTRLVAECRIVTVQSSTNY